MKDKLKEFANNEKIEIPNSFELRFEDALNSLPDKKSYKSNRYKAIASIGMTLFIASGVAIAMSDGIYKYIPTQGIVMDSEKKIYIMEEPLVGVDNNGNEIAFEMSIHEDMERAIVNISGEDIDVKPIKSTLKIGNKEYRTSEENMHEDNLTWGLVDVYKGIDSYNIDEEIIYTAYFSDIDKVEFKTTLKEAKGESTYSDIGITSKYNDVPITAVIDENKDNVTVNFMSELMEKGISVTTGIDSTDGRFTGVYLEDSNDNRVYGTRENSSGGIKLNQINFDTSKITKPYKLVVPQIRIDLNYDEEENYILASEEVTLPIPKDGESIDFDKVINFDIDDKTIETDNNMVKVVSGTRIKNKYIVEIEYPKNEKGKCELISVMGIESNKLGKEKITWSQADTDEDMNFIQILEFDINSFDKEVEFKLAPTVYELKGNWEFEIK